MRLSKFQVKSQAPLLFSRGAKVKSQLPLLFSRGAKVNIQSSGSNVAPTSDTFELESLK